MGIPRLVKSQKVELLKEQAEALKPIQQKITSLRKEVTRLEEEILKCLTGESSFTEKQLSEAISERANALSDLEQERDLINDKTTAAIHSMDELIAFKQSAVSWKKEFSKATAENQKKLIGMVVERVHISREAVDIMFRYSFHDIEDVCGSKIIWHGGAPPCCPIGSACGTPGFGGGFCDGFGSGFGGFGGGWGGSFGGGFGGGFNNFGGGNSSFNWLGSVTEIPINRIASFVHNTI